MSFYQEPKTNWVTNDGITASDLNLIGDNMDHTIRVLGGFIEGFEIDARLETTAYAGEFEISRGRCGFSRSSNTNVAHITADWTKTNAAFATGNGNGSKAPGSSAFADTEWWYVFLLFNSTTGAFDYAIDDDINGVNAATISGFDLLRMVSCIQARGAGGFYQIFSRSDTYYVNTRGYVTDQNFTQYSHTFFGATESFDLLNLLPELYTHAYGRWSFQLLENGYGYIYPYENGFSNTVANGSIHHYSIAGDAYYVDYYIGIPVPYNRKVYVHATGSVTQTCSLVFHLHNFKWDRSRQGERSV